MFIYLSKKIAIPNCTSLSTVAWNNDQGWIAVGGENGLLKVLKLETNPGPTPAGPTSDTSKDTAKAAAPASPLSMNQTLEGHSGGVLLAVWNKQHYKLTTSDANGLIIVWILYKGVWYEEMINNRNKSVVASMSWNRDGQKICIAYEDGAVILGSVDGNRIWGKEIKNVMLAHVAWSPDGKCILFGTNTGELQLFDHLGIFMAKLTNHCDANGSKIAAMDWYDGTKGYVEQGVPCLAIAYETGKVQISRHDKDTDPVLMDTGMKSLCMHWNLNGTLLAISGTQMVKNSQGEEKETCVLQFWTPFGQFVKSLKVPGKSISSLSWEHDGLRLALAVDSFIYFANIRPDYKWSLFAHDVLVYSYTKFERPESTVVFWNTKNNDRFVRYINRLVLITSAGDHCLVIAKADEDNKQWALTVYNAIGIPLESKLIEFEPKMAIVSKSNVFVASNDILLHWQFKTLANTKMGALDAIRRRDVKERAFHIDDIQVIGAGETGSTISELRAHALAASEGTLLIARSSGNLYQYLIPSVTLDNRYNITFKPISMALNCSSSRVSLLDANGVLKLFDLEKKGSITANTGDQIVDNKPQPGGNMVQFERKDVWDVRWAEDDSELFAIMEKTRLFIFRDIAPEEPVNTGCYICDFDDLRVKTILLDEIMKDPENVLPDAIVELESKGLRDLRTVLNQKGLVEAIQFAEDRPIPKLWKIISECALQTLNFDMAQKAFVRCQDFQGLQFIKKLKKLDDSAKQKAEIASYCGQFDEAEKLYLEMDRKDLAIELRVRLGDWFRVVQLIKTGGATDDSVLEKAWNHIGDHYYDRQRWTQATTYYLQGRNFDKLAECYYVLEDYDGLGKIVSNISDNNPLLKSLAEKLLSVGLCDQSVTASLKMGDVATAISTCVYLNQWTTAIELAELHRFKEIEMLLAKYGSYLLTNNRKWEAIELYRKANYCQKSARLLFESAKEAVKTNQSVMTIKKLYVLAALEVERYHSIAKAGRGKLEKTNAALDGLLTEENAVIGDAKYLDNPWRGAEAYHFYILSQRQLYSGNLDGAVVTAMQLTDYEDILSSSVIYSLLALVSFYAKRLNTCSKTFIRLESLAEASEEDRTKYEELALSIFTKHKPVDPKGDILSCTNCMNKLKSR